MPFVQYLVECQIKWIHGANKKIMNAPQQDDVYEAELKRLEELQTLAQSSEIASDDDTETSEDESDCENDHRSKRRALSRPRERRHEAPGKRRRR